MQDGRMRTLWLMMLALAPGMLPCEAVGSSNLPLGARATLGELRALGLREDQPSKGSLVARRQANEPLSGQQDLGFKNPFERVTTKSKSQETPEQAERRRQAEEALKQLSESPEVGSDLVGGTSPVIGLKKGDEISLGWTPDECKSVANEAGGSIELGPCLLIVDAELARGGFGAVYEARLVSLSGKENALAPKVAFKQLAGKTIYHAALQREFLFMKDFHSRLPSCALFPYGLQLKENLMVMELAYGTLYRWLEEDIVSTPLRDETQLVQIRSIMVDLLLGLSVMHKVGYAHRDVKLQNLLVTCTNPSTPNALCRLVIADFGLACVFDQGLSIATLDETLFVRVCKRIGGTEAYMPPELHAIYETDDFERANDLGKYMSSDIFAKQDIWAAGIVFAILLDPFQRDLSYVDDFRADPDESINEIVEEWEDLRNTPTGVEMVKILRRMLVKDPAGRSDAAALHEAMLKVQAPKSTPTELAEDPAGRSDAAALHEAMLKVQAPKSTPAELAEGSAGAPFLLPAPQAKLPIGRHALVRVAQ